MTPARARLPNRRPSHIETLEVGGRAVVSWEGPGEPIVLTLHGPDGEVAVPLLPKRALTLAQELLTRGVQDIKANSWGTLPLAVERWYDYPEFGVIPEMSVQWLQMGGHVR